ncbi:SAM-dependent methyltransferase [Streptomyces javensis]|uniref:Methyltransferase domain-containing protein n=1 Tax=Streptomyces javensis TaxID=114698 RepID=A0ABN1WD61_9ACTN
MRAGLVTSATVGRADAARDRPTGILTDQLVAGPGDRVLDVGCGQGRPGVRMATRTGAELTGISISARDVEVSDARAEREGCADECASSGCSSH